MSNSISLSTPLSKTSKTVWLLLWWVSEIVCVNNVHHSVCNRYGSQLDETLSGSLVQCMTKMFQVMTGKKATTTGSFKSATAGHVVSEEVKYPPLCVNRLSVRWWWRWRCFDPTHRWKPRTAKFNPSHAKCFPPPFGARTKATLVSCIRSRRVSFSYTNPPRTSRLLLLCVCVCVLVSDAVALTRSYVRHDEIAAIEFSRVSKDTGSTSQRNFDITLNLVRSLLCLNFVQLILLLLL